MSSLWADLHFCHNCYSLQSLIRAANCLNSAISLKHTFNRIIIFVTSVLGHKKVKTGIGEQSSCINAATSCLKKNLKRISVRGKLKKGSKVDPQGITPPPTNYGDEQADAGRDG